MTGSDRVQSRWADMWIAVVPLVVGVIYLALGDWLRGLVGATVAIVLVILAAVGIDLVAPVRAVGKALGALFGGIAWFVVVLPAYVWAKCLRRDPIRLKDARQGPHWRVSSVDHAVGDLGPNYGAVSSSRSFIGRLNWALGVGVTVLVTNYLIGWGWDVVTSPQPVSSPAPRTNSTTTNTTPEPRDPRIDLPAMAGQRWAVRYFADLQRTPSTYWPFTENRPLSFSSPYININDWARRSYEPATRAPMPTVWIFGGSTTFGEGQRDEFTISSWLARIAEQSGSAIRVVNYGQRGWTNYQEMLLFDELLLNHAPPAIVLFYDGANELTSQALMTKAVPTTSFAVDYAERLSGLHVATEASNSETLSEALADLYTAYTRHSAINKLARWIGLTSEPATAEMEPRIGQLPSVESNNPLDGFNVNARTADPAHNGYNFKITIRNAKDALRILHEGQILEQNIARRHKVQPLFFWQPVMQGAAYQWASEHLVPPTIDVSHALDHHRNVFIDGGHTNEAGARIVAEAIWPHLKPAVAEWYGKHR